MEYIMKICIISTGGDNSQSQYNMDRTDWQLWSEENEPLKWSWTMEYMKICIISTGGTTARDSTMW